MSRFAASATMSAKHPVSIIRDSVDACDSGGVHSGKAEPHGKRGTWQSLLMSSIRASSVMSPESQPNLQTNVFEDESSHQSNIVEEVKSEALSSAGDSEASTGPTDATHHQTVGSSCTASVGMRACQQLPAAQTASHPGEVNKPNRHKPALLPVPTKLGDDRSLSQLDTTRTADDAESTGFVEKRRESHSELRSRTDALPMALSVAFGVHHSISTYSEVTLSSSKGPKEMIGGNGGLTGVEDEVSESTEVGNECSRQITQHIEGDSFPGLQKLIEASKRETALVSKGGLHDRANQSVSSLRGNDVPSRSTDSAPNLLAPGVPGKRVDTGPVYRQDAQPGSQLDHISSFRVKAAPREVRHGTSADPSCEDLRVNALPGAAHHFSSVALDILNAGGLTRTDSHSENPNNLSRQEDSIEVLDRAVGPNALHWISAGGHRAEAGFRDPSLGWINVRAELGPRGIDVAVVPTCSSAGQVLGSHVELLGAHLEAQGMHVHSVTLTTQDSRLEAGTGGGSQQQHGGDAHREDRSPPSGISVSEIGARSLPGEHPGQGRLVLSPDSISRDGMHISVTV